MRNPLPIDVRFLGPGSIEAVFTWNAIGCLLGGLLDQCSTLEVVFTQESLKLERFGIWPPHLFTKLDSYPVKSPLQPVQPAVS